MDIIIIFHMVNVTPALIYVLPGTKFSSCILYIIIEGDVNEANITKSRKFSNPLLTKIQG